MISFQQVLAPGRFLPGNQPGSKFLKNKGMIYRLQTADNPLRTVVFFGGLGVRHQRVVLAMSGSHVTRMGGSIKILMAAEINAPRANMRHMLLMISIFDTIPTPRVAKKRTLELVMMELYEVVAAICIAV